MITAEFTQEEVQSLIQSLEAERDHYLKEFGSNRFSFVRARPPCSTFWREIAERVVEQNPNLIRVSERSEANYVVKLRIPLMSISQESGTISLFKNSNC